MTRDAGCADVDREAQRVPAGDARADQPLVEHVEPLDRADPLARRRAGSPASRPAAPRPGWPRGAGPRRATAYSSELGLVDSSSVTTRSTTFSSISSVVAEVDDRRLGQAADDLVGRGDHQVGAGLERARRQLGREPQVRPPGLVHHQRHAVRVCDLGERRDVGARAEVGRRDADGADRVGRRVERGRQRVRGHAVRDPEVGVELGSDERGLEPRQDGAVDHARVGVALDDERVVRRGGGRGRRRGFPGRRR